MDPQLRLVSLYSPWNWVFVRLFISGYNIMSLYDHTTTDFNGIQLLWALYSSENNNVSLWRSIHMIPINYFYFLCIKITFERANIMWHLAEYFTGRRLCNEIFISLNICTILQLFLWCFKKSITIGFCVEVNNGHLGIYESVQLYWTVQLVQVTTQFDILCTGLKSHH